MDTLLLTLAKAYGPTANEKGVKDLIEKELDTAFDEIRTDALGNFIGYKRGTDKAGKKIMLTVPMDEKCFIITHVEKRGKYKFSILGSLDFKKIVDANVVFGNGVKGTILLEEYAEEPLKVSDLYIETQILDEEQKGSIKLGSSAVFDGKYIEGEDNITSPALNPRGGCKILIDLVKSLDINLKSDLFVVFSCHGMVESRGTLTAAYGINPDIGISLGGISEEDGPELGQGPVIIVRDMASVSNPDLIEEFEKVAHGADVKNQRAISPQWTSNAAGILRAGCDTKIISLGYAVKAMATDKEQISKEDMEKLKKLIYLWLKNK